MRGGDTLSYSIPPGGPEDLPSTPFEEEDEKTVLAKPLVTQALKTIPFGSKLGQVPLRVYMLDGQIRITSPVGTPIDINMLPDWEIEELNRHVAFAMETGMLP